MEKFGVVCKSYDHKLGINRLVISISLVDVVVFKFESLAVVLSKRHECLG